MNRRAFLLAPFLVPAQAAPSVHLRGTLTTADSGGLEGYYALCEGDVCNALETLGISVHPKNPIFADDLRAMAGQHVQVSIFQVPRNA